jgi:glycosyltransferase involved in cell wall biosynthesis
MKIVRSSKLLFIATRYPPQEGGLARAAERNARFIASEYDLIILNLTERLEPGHVEHEQDGRIVIYRLGASKRTSETLRMAATLIEDLHTEHQFDIFVGFYLVYGGYLAAYYGRRYERSSFVSVRGNDLDTSLFTPEHLPFIDWTLKNAGLIGCVTRSLVAEARALSGRSDILYTPNSVDSEFWRPEPREESLASELGLKGQAVLGFVGELRQKKAPAALLDGFATLHERLPAKLLLVGSVRSSEREQLDRFVLEHPRLGKDIHLIDYLESPAHLRRYYSLIDIVILPSLWEGMSNALLEAMAMERIVLASSAGGNSEIIDNEKNGFLIARNCLDALGQKLIDLSLYSPERLKEIATEARKTVQNNFSPKREMKNLLNALAGLLSLCLCVFVV